MTRNLEMLWYDSKTGKVVDLFGTPIKIVHVGKRVNLEYSLSEDLSEVASRNAHSAATVFVKYGFGKYINNGKGATITEEILYAARDRGL
ncbi:MAG: hypothetical protein Q7S56_03230 [Nanoarchaeota archaeon]|nr:hypothetical protein [Nanoarchaeota archaeon]